MLRRGLSDGEDGLERDSCVRKVPVCERGEGRAAWPRWPGRGVLRAGRTRLKGMGALGSPEEDRGLPHTQS